MDVAGALVFGFLTRLNRVRPTLRCGGGRSFVGLVTVLSLLSLAGCGSETTSIETKTNDKSSSLCASLAIPNQYIVRKKDGTISVRKAKSAEHLKQTLAGASSEANQIDLIESDYRVHIHARQPMSAFSSSSHKTPDNWGQLRVGADQAWSTVKGEGVIVAVIDAGADLNHPQLRNQVAINTAEIPGNGIDDDKNGFIDDYLGFDFAAGNGAVHDAPNSTHHGSHVAGIILAEHLSDGSGIKGVAPGAKLLALNFMDDDGNGNISDAIIAINYAVARGAKVINASWGAEFCSRSLQATIESLESKGVLFVAAAGNGDQYSIGYNLDFRPTYPAAYPIIGQITVGAIDDTNFQTGFSNFSKRLVHLLAPGLDIWSTVYDSGSGTYHGYLALDGTSMAAPFVSGAAALLWSQRPKATVAEVKRALLESVSVPARSDYWVASRGYLNIPRALELITQQVSP